MVATTINDVDRYRCLGERFSKAFDFLKETDFSVLPVGKIVIDGDAVFAEVQEYDTMPESSCRFESHKKYFDVQYVADGEEVFGYIPLGELKKDTGYDETKDIEFYQFPEKNSRIPMKKGSLVIAGPEDGHQPRCISGTSCHVKKIVVKVKVD